MKAPVVIVGVGQLGGVFARGFLRAGHPVFPVTRDTDISGAAQTYPEPELVLVSVAENDLHPVLEGIPAAWRDKLALLQNELLPRDWLQHDLPQPTVIVAWFEKKPGQDAKVLIPSPVHGPASGTAIEGLAATDIPARQLGNDEELLHELVLKNVYILTTNIAGMITGGTVSELKRNHLRLAEEVAQEVIEIQEWLTDAKLPRRKLIDGMFDIFDADPEHKCTGRSAPARLERALGYADRAGLDAATMRDIQRRTDQK